MSLLWHFDGQYTCVIHLKKTKIVDGHDGQYTCVIFILLKKKIVARQSTVRWLSLLWYFDGQYTCEIDYKKKNCWWSWWSIHLHNIYFIKKKNRRKKKHCSVIVFALTFRWSIHVCNTFEKKKIIDGHDGQYTCVIIILLKKKIVARRSTVRWLSLLWYFDDQYTCVIDLKKKKIGNGHDGQYTCVIFILLKKKIFARESTVWWLSLLWYFDGQYTCVID